MGVFVKLTEEMKMKARKYSLDSHDYTSRGHDFHEGGADRASEKMYEGKLGEEAFKEWLIQEGIPFTSDSTGYDTADEYDFLISGYKVDVKTRTEDFHRLTLEIVEQFNNRPKDIYVGARLHRSEEIVEFYGVISAKKLKGLGQITNNGYKENYYAKDNQLGTMELFKQTMLKEKEEER